MKDLLKQTTEELLRAMDFLGEVEIDDRDESLLVVNIQSPEAAYLIGQGGETLRALQQVCRAIVNKKLAQPLRFFIDVNGYQKNRLELLRAMAKGLAQEALAQKEPRWLAPMNAYERRVIHLALAELSGIKTESEGEGGERRVVIKPVTGEQRDT